MLKAPFPWFGGKSRAAHLIWDRFGNVLNYVEPFFGSGAVLLNRPHEPGIETVNDLDGFVANAWRAIAADPDGVAIAADWPISENDLHARHVWLRSQRVALSARLEADPDYFDAKIAGWWLWGMASWIGSGFCGDSGTGPWVVEDGLLVDRNAGQGIARQLPHLGDAGRGIARQLPHLGSAGQGIARQLPHLGSAGQGIARQLPHLGDAGRGIADYMHQLAARLRRVRVCCGDWARVLGPSVTWKHGVTGILLDPPYADTAERTADLYAADCDQVAHAVREWAIENGDNPQLRIALCGYEGEHAMPDSWECVAWKAHGGFGSQSEKAGRSNAKRERIWFSPHCLRLGLFGALAPEQNTAILFGGADELR